MATVYDKTGNALAGHSSGGAFSGVLTRLNRLTIPVGSVTGDVFQLFDVAAGERVLAVAMKVVTGTDQTTPLVKIGLQGGTEAGYLADSSILAATAGTVYIGVGAYLGGTDIQVAFASADTIDAELTVTGTLTVAAVLDVELITVRTTLA
jgi:hypothetical protein